MFHEQTSGTSGTCLDLWRSRDTVQAWYALFEARCRRWYGLSRDMRWAILGGQLVRPIAKREPPFWIWNSALNQLYMSSYHLAPELIPSYVDALRAYDIKYVFGFTSSLYALAQEIVRQGRDDLRMAAAVTQGEPVFDYQRATISQAFHCPVRESYGMAEIVVAASECDEGRLHLWPETGLVEVLNANDQPAAPGETGELVCTGLLNADMPLIRYRLGDRGALAPDTPCSCGRRLPALAALAGRIDEVIYTTDGRPLGRLDSILRTRVPIREAQIIQETLDRVRVRLVPAPGFSQSAVDEITSRLQARLGKVQVVIESVPEVPRTANGKFRAVICQVPRAEVERRRAAASVPVS